MSNTKELNTILIEQEHHNLLPFTFAVEEGVADGSSISFSIEGASNSYFDYLVLVDGATPTTANESPVYVPEDKEAKYEHHNTFHVEVLTKDVSGLKEYNVRTQKEIYGFESPESSFNVPKFSWSNDIFDITEEVEEEIEEALEGAEEETEDLNIGYVWVGRENNVIDRIRYHSDDAEMIYEKGLSSSPHSIVFEDKKSRTYITEYYDLVNSSIDNYKDEETSFFVSNSVSNPFNDVIALPEEDTVWTLQSYYGKVVSRIPETLAIENEYSGFDAPHKMLWSKYHQHYIVAGINILWKLQNGVKTAIYEVKGYDIVDIACSPDGYVCILLDGVDNDIIRILKPDLYKIAISETIVNGSVRYCTYCDQGIFYILIEVSSSGSYGFINYVYDSRNRVLNTELDTAVVATTTTTTTAPIVPINKVELDFPNGGETLALGADVEILWRSTESITDFVKIELYRGGSLQAIIAEEADNTGIYGWNVPLYFDDGIDYKIKVTWLGATDIPTNADISDEDFTISIPETTTTTTTTIADIIAKSIGIGFNPQNRHIVNVLSNGLVGFYDLDDKLFYGLFDSNIDNVTCMAVRDEAVPIYDDVSAVRVFVGSDLHLNNMWDSGVVETDKNAMYYGGGSNLIEGETYYVNIQVYDVDHGWSSVQTKEWVMPR